MPVAQSEKQKAVLDQEHRRRRDRLGQSVLRTLGEPSNLQRVQVHELWDGHYRVNIYVGVDGVSARVAHSYFLVLDGDANIVSATPAVTRRYRQAIPSAASSEGPS